MNKKEIIKQGINLFNKHFPNDKHTTETEKSNLVKFFIDLHELREAEIKFYKVQNIKNKREYRVKLKLMKQI